MQRQHPSYPYGFNMGVAAPTRYAHGTSSAQSPSANPDEDWTKISDLAERRRIQNRIAQRNYRKKLKRRLEDLERRAGSSSASPEQKPVEMVPSQGAAARKEDPKKRRASKPTLTPPGGAAPAKARSPGPAAAPAVPYGRGADDSHMFAKQYHRQLSASPPPALTYSAAYGVSGETGPALPAPYPQHAPYQATLPAPYSDYPSPAPVYLPPLPMARAGYGPPPTGYEGGPAPNEAELLDTFQFNYASVHGLDAPATTQPFADSQYAPSPADAYAFGGPRAASPSQSLPFGPGAAGLGAHPVLGF